MINQSDNNLSINFETHQVEQYTPLGESMVAKSSLPLVGFLQQLGRRIPFESGLLPPGTISIRRAGDYEQFVIVTPPGINTVCWGASERDMSAKNYSFAQPFRVIIAEFHKQNLLGCRMFYTPKRIDSEADQLYHINLPNVNCKGYRGTGVGWICLYHKDTHVDKHMSERIAYAGLRCSGNEAYNDANMSGTDGARFYKSKFPSSTFLWDPKAWEDKSEKDGWQWTLDPNLWIPITVEGIDSQAKHTEGGVPLTLGMAMRGTTNFYYTDHTPKLYNILSRDDLVKGQDVSKLLADLVINPVMHSARKETIKVDTPPEVSTEQVK